MRLWYSSAAAWRTWSFLIFTLYRRIFNRCFPRFSAKCFSFVRDGCSFFGRAMLLSENLTVFSPLEAFELISTLDEFEAVWSSLFYTIFGVNVVLRVTLSSGFLLGRKKNWKSGSDLMLGCSCWAAESFHYWCLHLFGFLGVYAIFFAEPWTIFDKVLLCIRPC